MAQKEFVVGGRGAWSVFIVLTLLYLINRADVAIIAVALQPIKQMFNLSDAQMGLIPSMVTLGMAILTIPASMLGDRWVRRKGVMLMGLIWSVFTFATGIVTSFWQLLTARFMVGAGEAGYTTTGVNWLAGSFKKEIRALIISLFWVGGQLGMVVGMIVGGILVALYGWQSPFYFFAVPGIILAIIAFFLPDFKTIKQTGESFFSKQFFKDLGNLFRNKSYVLGIISQSFYFFFMFAWMAWQPTLLMRAFNVPVQTAGQITGMCMLGLLIGSPLGGFISDRWQKGNKNGRVYSMITLKAIELVVIGATLLLLNTTMSIFIAGCVVMAICMGMIAPSHITIITDVCPLKLRSSAMGMSNFIAQITGATLGSLLVGVISDKLGGGAQGIQIGLAWLLIGSFLSMATLFFLPRFYPGDSANTDMAMLVKD
jgi:MFS family permease